MLRVSMAHTVLVVEDNLDLREILAFTLSEAAFVVIKAESMLQALERLNERPQLDLVLADFHLSDGRNLVPIVKTMRPNLPIVVLSGDPHNAKAALPQADAVLGKPVAGRALVAELRRLLRAA
jgi:CheY-like chemotaxis protein